MTVNKFLFVAPFFVLAAGLVVWVISWLLIRYIFPRIEARKLQKEIDGGYEIEELDLVDEAEFYKQMEEELAEKFYDQDGVIYGGWAIPWSEVGPFRRSSYINRARLAISFVEEYGSGDDE